MDATNWTDHVETTRNWTEHDEAFSGATTETKDGLLTFAVTKDYWDRTVGHTTVQAFMTEAYDNGQGGLVATAETGDLQAAVDAAEQVANAYEWSTARTKGEQLLDRITEDDRMAPAGIAAAILGGIIEARVNAHAGEDVSFDTDGGLAAAMELGAHLGESAREAEDAVVAAAAAHWMVIRLHAEARKQAEGEWEAARDKAREVLEQARRTRQAAQELAGSAKAAAKAANEAEDARRCAEDARTWRSATEPTPEEEHLGAAETALRDAANAAAHAEAAAEAKLRSAQQEYDAARRRTQARGWDPDATTEHWLDTRVIALSHPEDWWR